MPNKSTNNLRVLIEGIKRYISLNKDYARLDLVEKLTILLSTLILILILIILGMVALFYLLFALAYILEPLIGGLIGSFLIITALTVLLSIGVYFNRINLIIKPMVRFLSSLFLDKDK